VPPAEGAEPPAEGAVLLSSPTLGSGIVYEGSGLSDDICLSRICVELGGGENGRDGGGADGRDGGRGFRFSAFS